MRPGLPDSAGRAPRRTLAALVAVALWLAVGVNAPGSTVGAVPVKPAAGHKCKCGMACRGASCCCASDAPAPARKAEPSGRPARPSARPDGPCVGSAPCGGEGLPGPPSGRTAWKPAAVLRASVVAPTVSQAFAADPSTTPLPSRRASRLDDPPDRPPVA